MQSQAKGYHCYCLCISSVVPSQASLADMSEQSVCSVQAGVELEEHSVYHHRSGL